MANSPDFEGRSTALNSGPDSGVKSYWENILNKRITRRRALSATAEFATGAALLAACGGDSKSKDTSDATGNLEGEDIARFPLLTLESLPDGQDQLYINNARPSRIAIRRGSQLAVEGRFKNERGEEQVLFGVSDPLRKKTDGSSPVFKGIMYSTPEGREGEVSFSSILAANGGNYNQKEGTISINGNKKYSVSELDEAKVATEKSKIGAYFVDRDPLTVNPNDGIHALHKNPLVVAPDLSIQGISSVVQMPDGRIVGLGADGQTPVARAKFNQADNEWKWTVRTEAVQNYTIRELADAANQQIGVLCGAKEETSMLNDPTYQELFAEVGNKLVMGYSLWNKVVFKDFTVEDWRRMLANWDKVSADLQVGKVPEGFKYNWRQADVTLAFAEKNKLPVRAQALFRGEDDDLDTVISGGFNNEELTKIMEFMIKSKVIRHRGRIEEWGVGEVAGKTLFNRNPRVRFWYDRLGEGVVDNIFIWANQADERAKLMYYEDHILDADTDNLRRVKAKSIALLRHFKSSGVPVHKFGLENHLWIYSPPTPESTAADLSTIKQMGYEVESSETDVNVYHEDPFWTDRKKTNKIPDPYEKQATVLRNTYRAFRLAGGGFTFGGLSDSFSWLVNVGHPQTEAFIFDKEGKRKPGYNAIQADLMELVKPKAA